MRHPLLRSWHLKTAVARWLIATLILSATLPGQTPSRGWWLDEPVRFFQTNLPETASTLDAKRLVSQVAEFPANTLLFNMGGIIAQYPTKVPFHYVSRFMPPGRDLFGEIVQEAHARQMRVVGRFDLSKTQKPVFDAHPEWFFKRVNGEPVIYNGLYSACINGGYYREHALQIITEALENYPVDGLQRRADGPVSVRCLPAALSRTVPSGSAHDGG